MVKRRLPSLKRLYASLKDAPTNIASLELTEAGFKVTFREPPGAPDKPAAQAQPVSLIPGTVFPDDKSPIDAADLTLHPIGMDEPGN